MKKMNKSMAVFWAATMAATVFGGTTVFAETEADSPLKGLRVAVAHISMYDEWCTAVAKELQSQADELGISELNIQDANFDIEKQIKNIEDFVAQGYDAILMDPVDGDAIQDALNKAADAGIPVVAFDSGTNWDKLVTHIAWDHAMSGTMSADWVADYAEENLDGKVKIGMLTTETLQHVAVRGTAFKDELESRLGTENIEYVYEQDFQQTREGAVNVVTNNIAKPVDVIWGAVDNAAFGAAQALENNGVEGTIVVSAGGWGAECFNAINDDNPYYKMVIGVPPASIVADSYQALADYLDGKDVEREQNIELCVIDSTNIADYMQYVSEDDAE